MAKSKSKRKTRSDKFPITLHPTGKYCKKIKDGRYSFCFFSLFSESMATGISPFSQPATNRSLQNIHPTKQSTLYGCGVLSSITYQGPGRFAEGESTSGGIN